MVGACKVTERLRCGDHLRHAIPTGGGSRPQDINDCERFPGTHWETQFPELNNKSDARTLLYTLRMCPASRWEVLIPCKVVKGSPHLMGCCVVFFMKMLSHSMLFGCASMLPDWVSFLAPVLGCYEVQEPSEHRGAKSQQKRPTLPSCIPPCVGSMGCGPCLQEETLKCITVTLQNELKGAPTLITAVDVR